MYPPKIKISSYISVQNFEVEYGPKIISAKFIGNRFINEKTQAL